MREKTNFSIIRHYSRPTTATLKLANEDIEVEAALGWICRPMGNLYCPCETYSEHFLFQVPEHILGPKYQCTCGSMAGVIQHQNVLKWRCLHMVGFGCHANLNARWI